MASAPNDTQQCDRCERSNPELIEVQCAQRHRICSKCVRHASWYDSQMVCPVCTTPNNKHQSEGDLSVCTTPNNKHQSEGDLSVCTTPNNKHQPEGNLSVCTTPNNKHQSEGDLSIHTGTNGQGMTSQIEKQSSQISQLEKQISQMGSGPKLKSAELLWENKRYRSIWEVAFRKDGSIVFLAGTGSKWKRKSIERCLMYMCDRGRKPIEVPFPTHLNDARRLSVCRQTDALAVTDFPSDTECALTVYKPLSESWTCKTFTETRGVYGINITAQDHLICTSEKALWMLDADGKKLWQTCLKETDCDYANYLTTDFENHILVSSPNNSSLTVYNKDGKLLHTFPSQFIKEPMGVCTDQYGRVLVVDNTNRVVLMYTIEGHFLQHIIKIKDTKVNPHCISFYDNYLALGTSEHGLWLYKIHWE